MSQDLVGHVELGCFGQLAIVAQHFIFFAHPRIWNKGLPWFCLNSWDTLQNLWNLDIWAENFVQNPEDVHHKFCDPHFSNC